MLSPLWRLSYNDNTVLSIQCSRHHAPSNFSLPLPLVFTLLRCRRRSLRFLFSYPQRTPRSAYCSSSAWLHISSLGPNWLQRTSQRWPSFRVTPQQALLDVRPHAATIRGMKPKSGIADPAASGALAQLDARSRVIFLQLVETCFLFPCRGCATPRLFSLVPVAALSRSSPLGCTYPDSTLTRPLGRRAVSAPSRSR